MAKANTNMAVTLDVMVISDDEKSMISRARKRAIREETQEFFDACSANSKDSNPLVLWFAKKFGSKQGIDRGYFVAEIRQSFGKQYLIR